MVLQSPIGLISAEIGALCHILGHANGYPIIQMGLEWQRGLFASLLSGVCLLINPYVCPWEP